MEEIIKKDGYVYHVSGDDRHKVYFTLGKDAEAEQWQDEVEEIVKAIETNDSHVELVVQDAEHQEEQVRKKYKKQKDY